MRPKAQLTQHHKITIPAAPPLVLEMALPPIARPVSRMSAARAAVREFLSRNWARGKSASPRSLRSTMDRRDGRRRRKSWFQISRSRCSTCR